MAWILVLVLVMICRQWVTVGDPGFPVGGGVHPLGGHGPPMQVLFSENVCENERIEELGPIGRACARHTPRRSANGLLDQIFQKLQLRNIKALSRVTEMSSMVHVQWLIAHS